ncbi:MAG: hypothetical protein IGS54_06360 [Elainella sp. C42_A2020_010]|nr:hypothetical protein [Elainella sp. C42_A2020_010]RNJ66662.1 MAG: hypothetical protein EDM05_24795 [Leptolyngbya sp. IPPAS B-1204]
MPRAKAVPTLESVTAQAAQLSRTERLELISILQAMDEAEAAQQKPDKQTRKQIALERKGIRGGRGSFEDKYINGYGPYRYLRYWYGKTHKSVYLGRVKPSQIGEPTEE